MAQSAQRKKRRSAEGVTENLPNTNLKGLTSGDTIKVGMYDLFVLSIFVANLINPQIWSWWWLTPLVFWGRIYILLGNFVANAEAYAKAKRHAKEIKKEDVR